MTNKKYHTTLLFYLAAFFLPVLIMIGVLYSQKIYPGSERTILTSDGFHQYVIFATGLRNILHGDGSLFYTFTSGLGLNFYALTSYYLGSFLSPLYYFFTVNHSLNSGLLGYQELLVLSGSLQKCQEVSSYVFLQDFL